MQKYLKYKKMLEGGIIAAKMVRHYQRKSDKGSFSQENMKSAVEAVLKHGTKYMTAAKLFHVDRMTLKRHTSMQLKNPSVSHKACYSHAQVFSATEENMLADYLLQASKMHYGLSTRMTRKLAFQFAGANSKRMPASWTDNAIAGVDWLHGFMTRMPQLSLRSPEATSLARSTAFNRHNIDMFFNNLNEVRSRHQYGPEDIYNVDESGLVTVQKPVKVIANKGTRQVGRMTSAERGTLVTICCAVNAIGNAVPPLFVFPRVNFKSHMLTGAPVGSVGVANVSGWMTADNFLEWMKHFFQHTKCSLEHPVLLLLDNHESHVSVACLDLAKENGITLLTFPPHCSHKLQPLDRSVFGPLKKFYNASCDSWLMSNPRPMTIYDISSIVSLPYSQAFTQKNIKAGFAVVGIEPYSRNVFHDDEFLGSAVTDRPDLPSTSAITAQPPVSLMSHVQDSGEPLAHATTTGQQPLTTDTHECQPEPGDVVTPTHNVLIPSTLSSCSVNTVTGSEPITPEDIMPFPKAAARKKTGARRPQKTWILTDTPERQLLALQQKAAKRKGVKAIDSKKVKVKAGKKSGGKIKKNCASAKATIRKELFSGAIEVTEAQAESSAQPTIVDEQVSDID